MNSDAKFKSLYAVESDDQASAHDKSSGGGGAVINDDEPPLRDGDHTVILCKEFLTAFPRSYLLRLTYMRAGLMAGFGMVDIATMYLVISSKYTDAFGNPTAGVVVIAFAAMLTLTIFVLISMLWKKGDK